MRRLVQAVVVTVGLLLLFGLAVPFVVHLRYSSDQSHCANNLKSLALALHNYASTYQRFPAGTDGNRALPPEKRFSWLVTILPYLEGGIPVLRLKKEEPWDSEWNHSVPATQGFKGENRPPEEVNFRDVRVYYCPSNPNHGDPGWPGLIHYVGIAGLGKDAALLPTKRPTAGAFGYDRTTTFADFKKGTSATVFLAETATANGPWTAGGPATVRGVIPDELPLLGADGQFSNRHEFGASAAGFLNSGLGTNFAFADGSVRPFLPSTPAHVVTAMATLAEGGTGE
jgi:prepilin-type processing-associated H-X9-DG protein